ncbi:hypothetical protein K1719_016124 [Acacia pycnantha]|nr:hypothetical protein K1719_016124 [Acacia pycnantha]
MGVVLLQFPEEEQHLCNGALQLNLLIEVHLKFGLMPKALYLTVSLLDQYLYLVTIKKNELQLVGLTALLWPQTRGCLAS